MTAHRTTTSDSVAGGIRISASAPTWPVREIAVVFEELHNRIPDIAVTEEPAMLLSSFIHGIKAPAGRLDAAGLMATFGTACTGW